MLCCRQLKPISWKVIAGKTWLPAAWIMYSITRTPVRIALVLFNAWVFPTTVLRRCHYWILTGEGIRLIALSVVCKAFSETLHSPTNGKEQDESVLNCLLPHRAHGLWINFANRWYSSPCLPRKWLCSVKTQISTIMPEDKKKTACFVCTIHTVKYPRAFPTVHSSRACFKCHSFLHLLLFLVLPNV